MAYFFLLYKLFNNGASIKVELSKSCFNLREVSNLVFHGIIVKGDISNMVLGRSWKLLEMPVLKKLLIFPEQVNALLHGCENLPIWQRGFLML